MINRTNKVINYLCNTVYTDLSQNIFQLDVIL